MTDTEICTKEKHANSNNSEITNDEEKNESAKSIEESSATLEDLNPSEKQKILTLAKEEHYSGPLPHPSHLQAYAEIYPEAPRKIFNMAEGQQNHRHYMEESEMKKQYSYLNRGQLFGFLLALVFLLGGFYLITIDKNVIGITSVIIGLISIFVRRSSDKENNNTEDRK